MLIVLATKLLYETFPWRWLEKILINEEDEDTEEKDTDAETENQPKEENEDKNARLDEPINIVVAGGTASPPGFDTLFEKFIREAKLPIDVGLIIRPEKPVLGVAQGALIAAENASVGG